MQTNQQTDSIRNTYNEVGSSLGRQATAVADMKQTPMVRVGFLAPYLIFCSLTLLHQRCRVTIADEPASDSPIDDGVLRLNQIQVIGTHNSYHIAPSKSLLNLIGAGSQETANSIDYTHRPLPDQFQLLNIRQIELDIYADPEGGLYANPIGYTSAIASGIDAGDDPNLHGLLDRPGMKIIHSPGFDYRTTVPTLQMALVQVKNWSNANQDHVPILILMELKESVIGPAGVTPLPFHQAELNAVDDEILAVFDREHVITPDAVRGDHDTLRDAILKDGWPLLSESRGKVMFALDNEGEVRDRYLDGHPSLRKRMMFASVGASDPAAAFMKLNDPIGDFQRIQSAVRLGFLVRTRADANTLQARTGDTTQREHAFNSGAQFISTDYPEPDPRFSDYRVNFENQSEYRVNPITCPRNSR